MRTEDSGEILLMQNFSHGYLCCRRHKTALIAEQGLLFCRRYPRRKASAEWRLL